MFSWLFCKVPTLVHTCRKSPSLNWSYNNTTRWKANKVVWATLKKQQECIPVGCVPSAAVALSRGGVPGPEGVYLVWGSTWSQGGLPGPRGCTWSGGYLVWGCTWSGGGVCSGGCTWPRGVPCSRWGCLLRGCVCSSRGCTWSGTPPFGQTDACKNITFATSLRTVKIAMYSKLWLESDLWIKEFSQGRAPTYYLVKFLKVTYKWKILVDWWHFNAECEWSVAWW